ncbi:GAK system CofD-like protein [Mameliella sediminis]|uniref:GAK system CofD-like protein n=1 Tax=Mameliella sediminis TaxID=2836866 RepID=UPI001C4865F3|nr:GAK system CofD-like protein [Mameliella sediminis]MBV7393102.1 GAK system CofD-like protein [Mameliella sediminis]
MKPTPITVQREVSLPDDLRVARAESAPHLGPRILFFSGGSALNGVSRRLKRYSFNSMHLITPFDSGGSSRELREAFDMPAVGDLRSRLMALADETVLGQPDVYALFTHRFPKTAEAKCLRAEVQRMAKGKHALMSAIAKPMRQLIQSQLDSFLAEVPDRFDYRNASIGNLILAGGYLSHGRALEPVLFMMSKMVDVRGTVRAVVDENLHLGVDLKDGRRIIGQRALSGKEVPPINSPVVRCFLSASPDEERHVDVPLPKRNRKLIEQADVICYPPGSLYSSIIANLLPSGVGRAVAARPVPKVYLPSVGKDPEAMGHDLADQVAAILAPLMADAGAGARAVDLMTHVLCDTDVPEPSCAEVTKRHGIPCIRLPLRQPGAALYDDDLVARVLISLN